MVLTAEIPNGGWDPRVRAFRCDSIVDTFVILTNRFVILVDSLVSPQAVDEVVQAVGADVIRQKSLLVLNTHADWDHVWGNSLFSGPDPLWPAPIIGHRLSPGIMRSPESAEFMASFKAANPGRFDRAAWIVPDILFEGTLTIDCGDLTLQLLETPGHSLDHVSIWIPQIRLLLAADAAEAPLPFVSDAATLPALRSSLRRLAAFEAKTVLYCHAPGISDSGVIARNIAYFDELERRCRESGKGTVPEWSLEAAIGDMLPDKPRQVEFYRGAHEIALRAMTDWLEAGQP